MKFAPNLVGSSTLIYNIWRLKLFWIPYIFYFYQNFIGPKEDYLNLNKNANVDKDSKNTFFKSKNQMTDFESFGDVNQFSSSLSYAKDVDEWLENQSLSSDGDFVEDKVDSMCKITSSFGPSSLNARSNDWNWMYQTVSSQNETPMVSANNFKLEHNADKGANHVT